MDGADEFWVLHAQAHVNHAGLVDLKAHCWVNVVANIVCKDRAES